MAKTIFDYLADEINKDKIKTEDDIYKLNFDFLLKKAFHKYLKDKGKLIEKEDPKTKIKRREIQW